MCKYLHICQINDISFLQKTQNAAVDIAIETKDWSQLVDIVLRGEADLLTGKVSEDNEVQEFINNADAFKQKVLKIHEGILYLQCNARL